MLIEQYATYIGEGNIEEIKAVAEPLKGLKVLHVNSTKLGGGVSEILYRLIPLMRDLGIEAEWQVIKGDEEFFKVTKKIHNLLHMPGHDKLTSEDIITYMRVTHENLSYLDTSPYDIVFIHDPQPMGLIVNKKPHQKWIWRCHIDVSTPDEETWKFIEMFINAYDAIVFHIAEFAKEGVKVPKFIIAPSIDPFHDKNVELDRNFILSVLEKFGIDPERPIILQVSRFDRLKDPFGVIQAYKMVKKAYDCQLVLAGGYASDDPEGEEVYNEVMEEASKLKDVFILNLPPDSHYEINALQRAATVAIQKSIREGFGLVVTEAMWKEKPVVGSNVGGIRRQIVNGFTGYLVNSIEGTAYRIRQLLINSEMAKSMGRNAKERVRHTFLITRQLKDYLVLINYLINSDHIQR